MSLFKKILNSSFWLLIGSAVGRLAMFLANIMAARMLSQEIFGQFTTIRNTISMFEGFISGTIGTSATKHIAAKNFQNKTLLISSFFFINLVAVFLFILIIILFSKEIVNLFFLNQSNMLSALYFGILLLVFTTFSTLTQSILVGFEIFKKLAFISIMISTIAIPLIYILIKTYGLNGAILGVAMYFFLDFNVKIIFLYRLLPNRKKFTFMELIKQVRKIVLFNIPLLLAVIVNSVAFWYARILLIKSENTFSSIAVFDAAFQWLTIIMIITSATTGVALPMFSKAYDIKKGDEILKIFNINLIINLCISIVIAIVFILFSKQIMSLYGRGYVDGYEILVVLSITSIFFTLATLYNRFMISINNTNSLLIVALLGALNMYIVLFVFGIDTISLAWAFLTYYATSVIYYYFVKLKYQRTVHANIK